MSRRVRNRKHANSQTIAPIPTRDENQDSSSPSSKVLEKNQDSSAPNSQSKAGGDQDCTLHIVHRGHGVNHVAANYSEQERVICQDDLPPNTEVKLYSVARTNIYSNFADMLIYYLAADKNREHPEDKIDQILKPYVQRKITLAFSEADKNSKVIEILSKHFISLFVVCCGVYDKETYFTDIATKII
jgi:hypothetical protein